MRGRAVRTGLAALALLGAALAPAALAPAPVAADLTQSGRVAHVSDGDTVLVDLDSDFTATPIRVRITGVQAMELSTYSRDLSRIAGECHGAEATRRMHELVFGRQVRLVARSEGSMSRMRPRRTLLVEVDGQWRDVGRILIDEGHALWMADPAEFDHNLDYSVAAAAAAPRGQNLWDDDFCGVGPQQSAQLRLGARLDAPGNDDLNPNGEHVRVENAGTGPVDLGGWWLRDSGLRRYTFPAGTVLPARQKLYVHSGLGTPSGNHLYWGQVSSVLENVTSAPTHMGEGVYLFDPQGDLRAWRQYPCHTACPPPPPAKAPVVKAPVVKAPVVKAPVVKAPVVKAPVVKAPALRTPVARRPTGEAPTTRTPVAKRPRVKRPVRTPVARPHALSPR